MGPIWGWQDPGGPHVGPMNFAIWVTLVVHKYRIKKLIKLKQCVPWFKTSSIHYIYKYDGVEGRDFSEKMQSSIIVPIINIRLSHEWASYLKNGNPIPVKMVFILKQVHEDYIYISSDDIMISSMWDASFLTWNMTDSLLLLSTHKQLEMHMCLVRTVATDALVLKHQAISIHSSD